MFRFCGNAVELQFEVLQRRIGAGRQRQQRISLLALLFPLRLLIYQVPELPVLAALRQVQVARTQVVPHPESDCDLPSVLLELIFAAFDRCPQVGIHKPLGSVRRQRLQLGPMQAANDINGRQHGFCAALRFERQLKEPGLIPVEVAQPVFESLGISEQFHPLKGPAISHCLLKILPRDLLE